MEITTLYKRNAKGDIIRWQIHSLSDGSISVSYGIFGKKVHNEIIQPSLVKANEVQSRIKAKRKEGYKAIEDLYDNSPTKVISSNDLPRKGDGGIDEHNLYNYLQTYLPKNNTTADGFVLPMLAKTLEDNKPFDKNGYMLGQWKINGLRCIVGAEIVENNLFETIRFTYTSREGISWNLSWMDDILRVNLTKELKDMMVEEGVCLDGELYIPGYSVNDINSFVKNNKMPQHYKLQYWCYDICCENMSAKERHIFLLKNISVFTLLDKDIDKVQHITNTEQLITLPTYIIDDITKAIKFRDTFIDMGFEGLIVRNPNAEYAFGKRNSSMFKYKKVYDGYFTIVNIQADKRGLPIFTLQNDINSECFNSTINVSQKAQELYVNNPELFINKKALVEYRERSGVKEVPFHAKIIKVII